MAQAKKPEVKPYDDPNVHEDEIEPVLAVKQTRVIWILVFAILLLSWQVSTIANHVDLVIQKRLSEAAMQIQVLADIVEHELDDTNDNYEASHSILMKGQCGEAYRQAFQNKCSSREAINEQFQKLMQEQANVGQGE